ncbi:CHAP domain-containing protein [Staphylococcus aureus]|uniref:CHAP domain-containing protein n=2 Tax=Staphylococcus aureus TaxID=1280 RepID=UPI000E064716|nr:CHAP domain-containing protein [Staphylococcus aureus]MBF2723509.1 CHAP domain-containing protein [Staphylococcus aureus]MBU6105304.1 CHAP domain-containing protein [Staphylococcus aureus]MBY4565811.1 CHAP domain-containing protein [Staphylococcus aureus]MST37955.1 CHAP domain-containing protein [Staphylococcus aureus]
MKKINQKKGAGNLKSLTNLALELKKKKLKMYIYGALALIAILFIAVSLMSMMLMAPFDDELDESETSTKGCSVSGGSVEKKGKELFEQNARGGELEGKSDKIVEIAKKNKIPQNLFMAIIASESMWGKGENATIQKNPLSVMGTKSIHDSTYSSVEEGLNDGAKNLYDLYISKGLTTPKKIGAKYAPIGASNDPTNMNARWVPTVTKIMSSLSEGNSSVKVDCSSQSGSKNVGKEYKGALPSWSNNDPGKGNLYDAGQCTWYAFGIRQKMGKPISTYWHDAHKWNERAEAEGYKVGKTPKKGACWIAEQGAGGAPTTTGHVGIVIAVKNDNTFVVSEMNVAGGPYHVTQREVKMTEGYSFIY